MFDLSYKNMHFSGKSKCREFVIRFKSGNNGVMNLGNAEWQREYGADTW